MKQILKDFRTLSLVSLIVGIMFASVTLALLPATPVSALSKQAENECRDTYHNKQLTQDKFNRFKNSDCSADKGGNCTYTTSGNGSNTYYNIKCVLIHECRDTYHNKQLTQDKFNRFKNSDCSADKGGNCTYTTSGNGSNTYYNIKCSLSLDNHNSDDDEDTDEDSEEASPVGKEYDAGDCDDGLEGSCKMIDLIITITNAISGLAATVIVAMIVWGGIQYSMAGADASKVQAAKQKITNALIALLLLIFGFSIIQWLVPGGLI